MEEKSEDKEIIKNVKKWTGRWIINPLPVRLFWGGKILVTVPRFRWNL